MELQNSSPLKTLMLGSELSGQLELVKNYNKITTKTTKTTIIKPAFREFNFTGHIVEWMETDDVLAFRTPLHRVSIYTPDENPIKKGVFPWRKGKKPKNSEVDTGYLRGMYGTGSWRTDNK